MRNFRKVFPIIASLVTVLILSSISGPVFAQNVGDQVTWTVSSQAEWENGRFYDTTTDGDSIRIMTGDYDKAVWSDSNKYTAPWDEGWENGAVVTVDVTDTSTLRIKYEYRAVKTEDGLAISPLPHGEFRVEDDTHDNYIGYTDTETDTWQIKEFEYDVSNMVGDIQLIFWLQGAGSGDSSKYRGEMEDHRLDIYKEETDGSWQGVHDWEDYAARPENVIIDTSQTTDNTENVFVKVGTDVDADGTVDSWSNPKKVDNGTDTVSFSGMDSGRGSAVEINMETSDTSHTPSAISYTLEAEVTEAQPNPPENLAPTGAVTNNDVTLYADVSSPSGSPMDVKFYNAKTDELIGTDESVSSGSTASVTWYDRSLYKEHSFYAVAKNSTGTLSSDKSKTATFWGSDAEGFEVEVRYEDNGKLWPSQKVQDNLRLNFYGPDWQTTIIPNATNPTIHKVPPDVEYVIAGYEGIYSRKLLTHGDNKLTFMMSDRLDDLNAYVFNLADEQQLWGTPDGEIQLYKYYGGTKRRIYDSTWYSQNLVEVTLVKNDEYQVQLTSQENDVADYGSIMAGTYGEKDIEPPVVEENIFEGYLEEYIDISSTVSGGAFDVTYTDTNNRTNWVEVVVRDENNDVVDTENMNGTPNSWTYTYNGQENMVYLVYLTINHQDFGEEGVNFPVSTGDEGETTTIPGAEDRLGDFPVSFASTLSVFLLIVGIFATSPEFAGIGCFVTGIGAAFLWYVGLLPISPIVIILIFFIAVITQIAEGGGGFYS